MKLYEFAVLYIPTSKDLKAEIIVPPAYILAADERAATLAAAKKIPDEYNDRLDAVQVAVRPF